MNKIIIIPEENAIQLLHALNEFKSIYQEQEVGISNKGIESYLSEKQAAKYLNCSISTLQKFRRDKTISFYKAGKRIRYSLEALNQFIKSNSYYGTANGGVK